MFPTSLSTSNGLLFSTKPFDGTIRGFYQHPNPNICSEDTKRRGF